MQEFGPNIRYDEEGRPVDLERDMLGAPGGSGGFPWFRTSPRPIYTPTQIGPSNPGVTQPRFGTPSPSPTPAGTTAPPVTLGTGPGVSTRMSDFLRYGVGPVAGLTSTWLSNRANSQAAREAASLSERQFAITQAFLDDQEKRRREEHDATEAEKKRQWDEEQAELRRQWDAKEPWREASKANLVRMNSLMDEPRPARLDLSWMDRNRGF